MLIITITQIVVHFFTSLESTRRDLGDLLMGRAPQDSSDDLQIGSHDYSKIPRGIIFGRAVDPEWVTQLNQEFKGKSKASVAWIAADPGRPPPAVLPAGYAQIAADNIKKTFARWEASGANSEEIFYYHWRW